MRIAITGTHGTGKTTLLRELREIEPYKSSYTFVTELTRKLHERGYPINEQGTDEVQRILAQQCVEASRIPNSIADRCVLDNIVFTTFLFNEGKVNQETMNDAIEKFEANISNFDIIFYIRPEFDLVDDGVRTTSTSTRDKIFTLFELYIDKYKLPVVLLSGSVEERMKTILETIEKQKTLEAPTRTVFRVVALKEGQVLYNNYFGFNEVVANHVFMNLRRLEDLEGTGKAYLIEAETPGKSIDRLNELKKQYNIE